MKSKLEIAKEIIKANIKKASCGIFDCRNFTGDRMSNLYDEDGLTIDICYDYDYFEVFGLTYAEFKKLEEYYEKLRTEASK